MWDPERASATRAMFDSRYESVPTNQKEAAMAALHMVDYDIDKLYQQLENTKVLDGTDWTSEEKQLFRKKMFKLRKNIITVSKAVDKSVNNVFTYYLGTFKKSDDYRILKCVCEEERAERQAASDEGLDACAICGDGGSLLICDGCEGEYHMTCVKPPLAIVPEGTWECDDCVNLKFLSARERLIKESKLYERVDANNNNNNNNSNKRKAEAMSQSGDSKSGDSGKKSKIAEKANTGIIMRPSPKVLKAARTLAASISKALAATSS